VVARELGYQLVNEQIVAQAAREAGVTPETVADVEKRKGMLHRLLEGLSEVGPAGAAGFTGFAAIAEDPGPNRDALRGLIRSVLEESAEQGNVVIVAHAASLALGGNPDVLRVLITASPETRAKRVAEAQNVDEAEAKKIVERGDANRADYLKRFYSAGAESPTHYDIVINTDRVGVDDAAALILGAARSQQIPA
jgi:cytidylate kinase